MITRKLAGLNTIVTTKDGLAELMVSDVESYKNNNGKTKLIFSSNGQGISLYATDMKFKEAMDDADIIHADGQSVVLASKLLKGSPLPERIATTDFFHNAAEFAQKENVSFFFLGATEEDNRRAVENVKNLYPKLIIAGRRNGYFEDSNEIIREINSSSADVLWVALGKPRQEFWCVKHRDELNVAWVKTCGGLFDFLSGKSPRAPVWMQNFGLEWLFRLLQNPKHLWKRYVVTNPHSFFLLLFKSERK